MFQLSTAHDLAVEVAEVRRQLQLVLVEGSLESEGACWASALAWVAAMWPGTAPVEPRSIAGHLRDQQETCGSSSPSTTPSAVADGHRTDYDTTVTQACCDSAPATTRMQLLRKHHVGDAALALLVVGWSHHDALATSAAASLDGAPGSALDGAMDVTPVSSALPGALRRSPGWLEARLARFVSPCQRGHARRILLSWIAPPEQPRSPIDGAARCVGTGDVSTASLIGALYPILATLRELHDAILPTTATGSHSTRCLALGRNIDTLRRVVVTMLGHVIAHRRTDGVAQLANHLLLRGFKKDVDDVEQAVDHAVAAVLSPPSHVLVVAPAYEATTADGSLQGGDCGGGVVSSNMRAANGEDREKHWALISAQLVALLQQTSPPGSQETCRSSVGGGIMLSPPAQENDDDDDEPPDAPPVHGPQGRRREEEGRNGWSTRAILSLFLLRCMSASMGFSFAAANTASTLSRDGGSSATKRQPASLMNVVRSVPDMRRLRRANGTLLFPAFGALSFKSLAPRGAMDDHEDGTCRGAPPLPSPADVTEEFDAALSRLSTVFHGLRSSLTAGGCSLDRYVGCVGLVWDAVAFGVVLLASLTHASSVHQMSPTTTGTLGGNAAACPLHASVSQHIGQRTAPMAARVLKAIVAVCSSASGAAAGAHAALCTVVVPPLIRATVAVAALSGVRFHVMSPPAAVSHCRDQPDPGERDAVDPPGWQHDGCWMDVACGASRESLVGDVRCVEFHLVSTPDWFCQAGLPETQHGVDFFAFVVSTLVAEWNVVSSSLPTNVKDAYLPRTARQAVVSSLLHAVVSTLVTRASCWQAATPSGTTETWPLRVAALLFTEWLPWGCSSSEPQAPIWLLNGGDGGGAPSTASCPAPSLVRSVVTFYVAALSSAIGEGQRQTKDASLFSPAWVSAQRGALARLKREASSGGSEPSLSPSCLGASAEQLDAVDALLQRLAALAAGAAVLFYTQRPAVAQPADIASVLQSHLATRSWALVAAALSEAGDSLDGITSVHDSGSGGVPALTAVLLRVLGNTSADATCQVRCVAILARLVVHPRGGGGGRGDPTVVGGSASHDPPSSPRDITNPPTAPSRPAAHIAGEIVSICCKAAAVIKALSDPNTTRRSPLTGTPEAMPSAVLTYAGRLLDVLHESSRMLDASLDWQDDATVAARMYNFRTFLRHFTGPCNRVSVIDSVCELCRAAPLPYRELPDDGAVGKPRKPSVAATATSAAGDQALSRAAAWVRLCALGTMAALIEVSPECGPPAFQLLDLITQVFQLRRTAEDMSRQGAAALLVALAATVDITSEDAAAVFRLGQHMSQYTTTTTRTTATSPGHPSPPDQRSATIAHIAGPGDGAPDDSATLPVEDDVLRAHGFAVMRLLRERLLSVVGVGEEWGPVPGERPRRDDSGDASSEIERTVRRMLCNSTVTRGDREDTDVVARQAPWVLHQSVGDDIRIRTSALVRRMCRRHAGVPTSTSVGLTKLTPTWDVVS